MSDGAHDAAAVEAHDAGEEYDAGGEEEGAEQSVLELEREKHRKRAEKFGTAYVDPSQRKDLRLEARRERFTRQGFATGIDLFTEEEQQKLAARAERFGMQSGGLQFVPPEPDEDAAKRRARAERFGVQYQPKDETGLMDVDLLEQRHDVDPTVPRRPDAVHVYGVDLMSTGDCLKYFADYGPTFVEWINDSCCNVLFRDAATAKRAVVGLGKPLPPEEMPDLQGLDASDPANIELLWYKGEDFQKAGTAIPLIFRIATERDVKPRPGEGAGQHVSRGLWKAGGPGGGGQARGRGQRRRRGGSRGEQPPAEGGQEEGEGGEDVEMRGPGRRGGPRGGRRSKRRREGDVDMADAEEESGGGGHGGGGGSRARPRIEFHEAASRRMFAAALGGAGTAGGAATAPPEREQVDYGDL